MDAEAVTPTPPRDVGRTVFTQRWERLTFLHWSVEPGRVAAYMPPGVRPDTFDGTTYVGLIPFWMRDIGLFGSPPVPFFGSFCESNVRLYSVDGRGRRGVVFVTLDASRLAPVLVARAAGLPYVWARMRYRRRGPAATYTAQRLPWPPGPSLPQGRARTTPRSRIDVRIGDAIEPGPLEHFLTARWGLHDTTITGRSVYWPNEHDAWTLHAATLEHLDDRILAAAGFGDLGDRAPDSVLFAPGVDVRFGPRLPA